MREGYPIVKRATQALQARFFPLHVLLRDLKCLHCRKNGLLTAQIKKKILWIMYPDKHNMLSTPVNSYVMIRPLRVS